MSYAELFNTFIVLKMSRNTQKKTSAVDFVYWKTKLCAVVFLQSFWKLFEQVHQREVNFVPSQIFERVLGTPLVIYDTQYSKIEQVQFVEFSF